MSGASGIIIMGSSGTNSNCVNGVFLPTGELYNEKPLFRKDDDPEKWLLSTTQVISIINYFSNSIFND